MLLHRMPNYPRRGNLAKRYFVETNLIEFCEVIVGFISLNELPLRLPHLGEEGVLL